MSSYRTVIDQMYVVVLVILICRHSCLSEAHTLGFCEIQTFDIKDVNETGSITSPGFGTQLRDPSAVPNECVMELTVCNGCRLKLIFKNTTGCRDPNTECFLSRASVFVELVPNVTIRFLNSEQLNITSSRSALKLIFSKNPQDAIYGPEGFWITYQVIGPKLIEYEGESGESGVISNLGFPNFLYVTDGDLFRYQLQNVGSGFVRIEFSDWFLSKNSKVKIYRDGLLSDENSVSYDYESDRPFVISMGNKMLIEFDLQPVSGENTYTGFKANYTFTADSRWPDKPTIVGNKVFNSVFGGQISFANCTPGIIDFLWLIPRSNLIDPYARLRLRVDVENVDRNALEIRLGNTSDSDKWRAGLYLLSESGFYIRLRHRQLTGACSSFSAVFMWTKPVHFNNPRPCDPLSEFLCQSFRECFPTELECDGIQHCDDGTDESDCVTRNKACMSYWKCQIGNQQICVTRRCDGIRDCIDGSDEVSCSTSTIAYTMRYDYDDWYSNYGLLSIVLPVVVLSVVITIIIVFVVCLATWRKKRFRTTRAAMLQQTQLPDYPGTAGRWGNNPNNGYGDRHDMNSDVDLPPAYTDVIPSTHRALMATGGHREPTHPPPPPYTSGRNSPLTSSSWDPRGNPQANDIPMQRLDRDECGDS